ncbi:hypothetical protein POSPLADRAFT_1034904 [Postia placenta MAD-698-R-SB12]|uniref:Uncharacterized protein n=1 Tax=Postia placenta MAD-698-R-SB12 TaxID=670580 RepID=A0A1X6MVK4_9APHY|nr:hypothetical protein POSPLADRAFT_1034904 [Postia placenta MAD-698-R-SB12]OSX60262.1 hypothetical protein POSPLADRAFT_1034904 [Postia placenta MAD-698-R-SB12]
MSVDQYVRHKIALEQTVGVTGRNIQKRFKTDGTTHTPHYCLGVLDTARGVKFCTSFRRMAQDRLTRAFPLEAAERILRCAAAETDAGDICDETLRRPFGWLEIARGRKTKLETEHLHFGPPTSCAWGDASCRAGRSQEEVSESTGTGEM